MNTRRSDNPIRMLFRGDPRGEKFMNWLRDLDVVNPGEVLENLGEELARLLRTHAFDEHIPVDDPGKKWIDEFLPGDIDAFLASWEDMVERPVGGYVYFLESKEGGYVKIGRTTDLDERTRWLSIQMPWPVELAHYIECADPVNTQLLCQRAGVITPRLFLMPPNSRERAFSVLG